MLKVSKFVKLKLKNLKVIKVLILFVKGMVLIDTPVMTNVIGLIPQTVIIIMNSLRMLL